MMRKVEIMSSSAIALIIYFIVSLLAIVAFCRAAARGDRLIKLNKQQTKPAPVDLAEPKRQSRRAA